MCPEIAETVATFSLRHYFTHISEIRETLETLETVETAKLVETLTASLGLRSRCLTFLPYHGFDCLKRLKRIHPRRVFLTLPLG